MTTKPKFEQLPLPNMTITVKKGQNTWEKVDKLPTSGRVRIEGRKAPRNAK